ncbi:MAG: hypothetical protein ACXVW4_01310 [Nocardioides sp.]
MLTAQAAYVGTWAAAFPRAFYDSFPGANRYWVSSDGPYNEHLVRDVGAWYLALAVVGLLVLAWRDRRSFLLLGSVWGVFGVLHLGYHLAHLDELASTLDRVGEMVALGGAVALALLVLAPSRATGPTASTEAAR